MGVSQIGFQPVQGVSNSTTRARSGEFRQGLESAPRQLGAIAFVILACICVLGIEIVNLWHQRDQSLANARAEAGNLARSLGQQAEDTFRIADLSLIGPISRLEIDGTTPDTLEKLRQIMLARVRAFPALAGFAITDETGKCLATAFDHVLPDCDLAGRADFEHLRSHNDTGPRLGEPLKSSGSDAWIIPLSRRFNHPDGSFAGVVTTGVSISFLENYYESFNIGPHGAIVLMSNTADPVVLVRRPFVEANIGHHILNANLYRAVSRNGQAGDVTWRSATDGIDRLTSYRALDPYPLVVAVGFAVGDVLAPWRSEAFSDLLPTIFLVAVIAALGAWLAHHMRLRREAGAAFRLLAENSTDLIVRLGPDLARLYVSPACRAMLGYEPDELVGRPGVDLIHPDDRAIWRRMFDPAETATDLSTTYRAMRKDGTTVWCEGSRHRLAAEAGFVVSVRDVTRRKEAEDQLADANRRLEALANQDGLTGLANRRQFDAALEAEARRASRDGTTLSLIMIDVDRFKAFNDLYGHPAGDKCLQEIAAALRSIPSRPGDVVARYGGEEMAVILPNTPLAGALTIAERTRTLVRSLAIPHESNSGRIVTISLGVASIKGNGRDAAAKLIAAADCALYAAKEGGRDVAVAAPQRQRAQALS